MEGNNHLQANLNLSDEWINDIRVLSLIKTQHRKKAMPYLIKQMLQRREIRIFSIKHMYPSAMQETGKILSEYIFRINVCVISGEKPKMVIRRAALVRAQLFSFKFEGEKNHHFALKSLAVSIFSIFYSMTNSAILTKYICQGSHC